MAEDKVIIDDVISLLPQEQQGIVKLAVTLSKTLVAKEQAQSKAQTAITMVKNLLTFIAEDMMLDNYNWKEFTIAYLKDSSYIETYDFYNISQRYFKVISQLKIPETLAMASLQPVLNKLITKLSEKFPDDYAEVVGISSVKKSLESEDDDS